MGEAEVTHKQAVQRFMWWVRVERFWRNAMTMAIGAASAADSKYFWVAAFAFAAEVGTRIAFTQASAARVRNLELANEVNRRTAE